MWSNTIAVVNCVMSILYIQELETTKKKLSDTESRLEGTVKVCLSMSFKCGPVQFTCSHQFCI